MLGVKSSSKVSRYEKFAQVPNLKTAMMFQALFGVPVAEMFAGIYQQVEKDTAKRAKILIRKIQETKPEQMSSRKLELLRAIAITPDINKENP